MSVFRCFPCGYDATADGRTKSGRVVQRRPLIDTKTGDDLAPRTGPQLEGLLIKTHVCRECGNASPMPVAAFCPPAGHNKYCIYLVNNTTAPYIFAQKIISGLDGGDLYGQISAGTSVRYRTSIVTARWQPPRAKRHALNLCIFLIRGAVEES